MYVDAVTRIAGGTQQWYHTSRGAPFRHRSLGRLVPWALPRPASVRGRLLLYVFSFQPLLRRAQHVLKHGGGGGLPVGRGYGGAPDAAYIRQSCAATQFPRGRVPDLRGRDDCVELMFWCVLSKRHCHRTTD